MKKKIDEQLEELQRQVEEWKQKYLRALADYQNLERRNREEWEEKKEQAAQALLRKFLPILDTLSLAADHLKDPGLDLGMKSFTATLGELGVEKIEVIGKPFDPNLMECVEVTEGEENVVAEELLSGYIYKGRLLRAAKVKVGQPKGG